MDRSSFILKTIRELYDGVLQPELCAQAFESLCKLVAGEHLLFFTVDLHANRLQFVTGLNVSNDYFRRLAMAAETKIMPPGLLMMPPGSLKFAQDCWIRESFEKTTFYNEVVRPEGGYYGLVAAPFRQNRHGAFLAIERMHGQPDFDESDADTIRAVLPHLTSAMLVRLKLEDVEYNARQFYGALEQLDVGVLIVDQELRPFFMNRFAESLVAEMDGLALGRGKLNAGSLSTTQALRRKVELAMALHDKRRHRQIEVRDVLKIGERLEIPRTNLRPPLIAIVAPLSVEIGQRLLAPPSRAVIFVKRPQQAPHIDIAEMQDRFGLTPRQAKLTALLAQGNSLSQAGKVMGIAVETVRFHLRETFERTNTNRQIDLVRLVLQRPARDC
jgi:DNA-binding CsgD family transcriptional regulator